MRFVSLVLLLTALASIQLPWVVCEEENVHLDLGQRGDDAGHDHEPVEWSAMQQAVVAPIVITPLLHAALSAPALPTADAMSAATGARAVAPPFAIASHTTVLLL